MQRFIATFMLILFSWTHAVAAPSVDISAYESIDVVAADFASIRADSLTIAECCADTEISVTENTDSHCTSGDCHFMPAHADSLRALRTAVLVDHLTLQPSARSDYAFLRPPII